MATGHQDFIRSPYSMLYPGLFSAVIQSTNVNQGDTVTILSLLGTLYVKSFSINIYQCNDPSGFNIKVIVDGASFGWDSLVDLLTYSGSAGIWGILEILHWDEFTPIIVVGLRTELLLNSQFEVQFQNATGGTANFTGNYSTYKAGY